MTTTREVRPDQHGTYTGYTYGCRCDDCKRACSAYHMRASSALDCVGPFGPNGKSFPCQRIQGKLVQTEGHVAEIARAASRSKAAFTRLQERLAEAKADRDRARAERDAHMAECSGAYERWSA